LLVIPSKREGPPKSCRDYTYFVQYFCMNSVTKK
jgi:hypothetical protein